MRFVGNTEQENFLLVQAVQDEAEKRVRTYFKKQVTDNLSGVVEELTDDLIKHLKPQIEALIYRDAGAMLDTATVRFNFYTNGEKQQ